MKEIMIFYFYGTKFPKLKYQHKQTFQFSRRKRNQIIDKVMDAGYNILLQQSGECLVIMIDYKRFQQR